MASEGLRVTLEGLPQDRRGGRGALKAYPLGPQRLPLAGGGGRPGERERPVS